MPKSKSSKQLAITVVKDMRDYRNEPAFVKAAERATAFFKNNGLPKSFKKKAT
jgi:hypothetical protein